MRGLTKVSAPTGSVRRARRFPLVPVCGSEHRPLYTIVARQHTHARICTHTRFPIGLTRSTRESLGLTHR